MTRKCCCVVQACDVVSARPLCACLRIFASLRTGWSHSSCAFLIEDGAKLSSRRRDRQSSVLQHVSQHGLHSRGMKSSAVVLPINEADKVLHTGRMREKLEVVLPSRR